MRLVALLALAVVTALGVRALWRFLRDDVVTEDDGMSYWRGRKP